MIRHVVSWKLNSADATALALDSATIRAALESLPPLVSELKSLSVGSNVANAGVNWDLCLVADYDSLDDLEAYQVHPEHQRVAAVIRPLVESRAVVDFEL
ncbi:MAG: hypothetical protein JWM51_449 [Microbacteriaceae bacterium]|nr:hypothetical protein [Microbacteriaceae bacterium]